MHVEVAVVRLDSPREVNGVEITYSLVGKVSLRSM